MPLSDAAWYLSGPDRTAAFQDAMGKGGRSLPEKAPRSVLFVPGLSADQIEALVAATIWKTEQGKDTVSGYIEGPLAACPRLGLDCRVLDLNTAQTVEVNAKVVASALQGLTSDTIVIGHSRGGVDALRALSLLPPAQRARVKALVTLQSPHGGIVAAKAIDQFGGPLKLLFKRFYAVNGELTPDAQRNGYPAASMAEMRDAGIRFLTLGAFLDTAAGPGSAADGATPSRSLLALPSRMFVAPLRASSPQRDGRNDGIVALQDARLPGTPFVDLRGHDHVSTVLAVKGGPAIDPAAMLAAVIRLAFESPGATDGGAP